MPEAIGYRTYVRLNSDEWGNAAMDAKAVEAASKCAERPLLVMVMEHAGWYIDYLFEHAGAKWLTVDTANDRAIPTDTVRAAIKRFYGLSKHEVVHIAE